jgi:hypothetical protein
MYFPSIYRRRRYVLVYTYCTHTDGLYFSIYIVHTHDTGWCLGAVMSTGARQRAVY